MERRKFLRNATSAGVGLTVLRSGMLRGADAPSNKLNIGLIGTWGRGEAHFSSIGTENVGAL